MRIWTRDRSDRGQRALVLAVAVSLIAAVALLSSPASDPPALAQGGFEPPPIRHVWIINLENFPYKVSFESVNDQHNPYLAQDLPKQGALLPQYHGTGHESLDNYISQVSGQGPTAETQEDCTSNFRDIQDAGTDPNAQVIGQGCVYPSRVHTIGQQLDQRGLTWKSYQEDMGNDTVRDNGIECAHPPAGGSQDDVRPYDAYTPKHNPFVFFHRIIDDPAYCRAHDVPLAPFARDLQRVSTTPNLSFVTPQNYNDGHDTPIAHASRWLRAFVPRILASPAYRQDGLVIVTFDESGGIGLVPTENTSCCNEIPGPNSPSPGIAGPGGGRVGAVLLSPYIKPGTVTDHPYNHYSLLRSLEDAFRMTGGDDKLGHLGYAGTYTTYPGPGAFGADVYTANRTAPAQASGPVVPTGPRPADGSTAWASPLPHGEELRGVSCSSEFTCVAVGDDGAIAATADGQIWSNRSSPTQASLSGVSCPSLTDCVAVGDGGTILRSGDAGVSWSRRPSGTGSSLTAVSCAIAVACVAVGDGGTILASGDGGATWSSRSSGTQTRLASIDCPTATRCFAIGDGGTILTSGDGGAHWAAPEGAPPARKSRYFSISCSSATACLAVRDYWFMPYVSTADGGKTWHESDVGVGGGAQGVVIARGLSCANDKSCLVVGKDGPTFPTYGNHEAGSFLVSTAGGDRQGQVIDAAAARKQAANRLDGLAAADCPSAGRCYAVGDQGAIVAFRNLPQTSNDPPPAWARQRLGPPRELSAISCSGVACFTVGDGEPNCYLAPDCTTDFVTSATILAAVDGANWSLRNPGVEAPLHAVSCPSAASCVAVGEFGTVVRTQNGASWAKAPTPPEVQGTSLVGVSCPALSSRCVAVGGYGAGGANGSVLTSGDGGATWAAHDSGTPELLDAVSCASGNNCVAVGSLGTVVRSSDGGNSWSRGSSGTTRVLTGVSCPTAQHCVAAGSDATLLVSDDGGASWSARPSPAPNEDFRAVSCATALGCEAVGSTGTVVATRDGGASWAAQGTGTGRELRGVSCPGIGVCFEAGEHGAVLITQPHFGGQPAPEAFGTGGGAGLFAALSCKARLPQTKILRRSIRLSHRRVSLKGRALGRDCPRPGTAAAARAGSVRRVWVAVARKAAHRKCRFLTRKGRFRRARSCRKPIFLRARVKYVARGHYSRWSFRKRARLPSGTYRFLARSQDPSGLRDRQGRAIRKRLR